jgi:hypothetical protein
MEPYIKNLDLTKPLGQIVHKFCQKEYYRGFNTGFVAGIGFSLIVFYTLKKN